MVTVGVSTAQPGPRDSGRVQAPPWVPGAAQVTQEQPLGAQGRGFRLSQALAPPAAPRAE